MMLTSWGTHAVPCSCVLAAMGIFHGLEYSVPPYYRYGLIAIIIYGVYTFILGP